MKGSAGVGRSGFTHLARCLKRAGFTSVVVVLCLAAPALADRHCFPALDDYFAARQHMLDEKEGCERARQEALPNLENAIADAEICGCEPLVTMMQELLLQFEDDSVTCAGVSGILLGGEDRVTSTVRDCHH